jgi:hypothetical protein
MRIDRVYSEGEAVNALQQLGFTVQQPPFRVDQYIVAHPEIGGERTFTIEQLCCFAEGASVLATHFANKSATVAASAGR